MNLAKFRLEVQNYRQLAGRSQTELAAALGIQLPVLSRKLALKGKARLTHPEIKQIIKTLAEWKGLSSYSQVLELLELCDLGVGIFSREEWQTPPLKELVPLSLAGKEARPSQSSLPFPQTPGTQEVTNRRQANHFSLPSSTTPLVGRKWETATLSKLLKDDRVRLVTLLGPGGVGKTRLAVQVGSDLKDHFEDGIFFSSLANISEPSLVAACIAQTLELPQTGTKSAENILKAYLGAKKILLILDNFEQLVAARHLVGDLLASSQGLKILVTSRKVLDLVEEHHFVVPPLRLPDLTSLPHQPAELLYYEAIALFVERVQHYRFDFTLTSENGPIVAQICSWLDGLPLALELAAARLKIMSLSTLQEKLQEHRLKFLGANALQPAGHQRTLSSTLEWSYTLLSPAEQLVFRRLGVFSTYWSLEDAEKICADQAIAGEEVADLVEKLVKHSLISLDQTEYHKAYRFYMLETVRHYALEKLLAKGTEEEVTWEKAVSYFSLLAEAQNISSSNQTYHFYSEALRALSYLPATPDRQRQYIDLVTHQMDFALTYSERQQVANCLKEAEKLIQNLLATGHSQEDRLRQAWIYYWLSSFNIVSGQPGELLDYLHQALKIARQAHSAELAALCEMLIGRLLAMRGYFKQAIPLLSKHLNSQLKVKQWHDMITIKTYYGLAVAMHHSYQEGLAQLEQTLLEAEQMNNASRKGLIYTFLAVAYFFGDDVDNTLLSSRAAFNLLKENGPQVNMMAALALAAWAENKLGDYTSAWPKISEVKRYLQNSTITVGGLILAFLAEIALNRGELAEALKLAQQTLNHAQEGASTLSLGLGHRIWAQALAKEELAKRPEIEFHLKKALEAFEAGGVSVEMGRTYLIWLDLCLQWGDFEQAVLAT